MPPPVLGNGETHVWAFNTDAERPGGLERLLSADEIERANRFHFKRDRERYVVARGQLRRILGRYAKLAPDSVRLAYSAGGKPSLSPSTQVEGLRFNASRSDAVAMIALRLDAEVGIDVERLRPLPAARGLAERMLTVDELAELSRLPESQREKRLLEYWVRKEAVAKALGKGLQQSFDVISLHPWPGEEAKRVEVEADGAKAILWVIPIPAPSRDFVAALASNSPFGAVQCRDLHSWSLKLTTHASSGSSSAARFATNVSSRMLR